MAVFMTKQGRYGEAVDYANQSIAETEKLLDVHKGRPLTELKYTGKVREVLTEREKHLTTYAVANHLAGKALLNLQYYNLA